MKDWTWKNWLGVAAVVFVTWLIAYIAEWNSRNTAGISHGDALLGWLGDVVMLQWVDTTLGAGVLALIGATLVLVAALFQRRTVLIDAAELNRTTMLALLGLASLRAQKLLAILWEDKGGDAASLIESFEKDLSQLVSRAPGLAHWLQQVATEIDKYLEDVPGREFGRDEVYSFWRTKPDRWKSLAYAITMEEFLHGYERLVTPTGTYRHKPASMGRVVQRLQKLSKLTLQDLPLARGMFE